MVIERSTVMLVLIAGFALIALVALGFVLAWERRELGRAGKARGWRFVRLAALPLLLLTAAVVVLPARQVSGMEALAVFYGLLFTAAPLVWFGGHWLIGRAARPPLSAAESFRLAATLPVFLIATSMVAGTLQPLAWTITLAAESAGYGMASAAPPRHVLAASRRWTTASGEVLLARWQAPEDVRIARIDMVSANGEVLANAGSSQRHRLCQAPGAIVLLQPAGDPPPSLRVYWRDTDDTLRVSTLTAPQAAESTSFDVAWQGETGFDLPEPLPRQSIWLARTSDPAGTFFSSDAQLYQPGESIDRSCLPSGWQAGFALRGLRVRVERTGAPEPLWLEAVRRAPPTNQSS